MSAPINKYKFKGIEIADWGNGSFSLRKSYKPKDASEWVEHKIPKLFREELVELGKLIREALSAPIQEAREQRSLLDSLPKINNQEFTDDDLGF